MWGAAASAIARRAEAPAATAARAAAEQRGVVRHHAVRVDDVGVGIVTLESQARGQRVELDHDERQPAFDAHPLVVGISAWPVVAVDTGPGRAERGARSCRVAAERDLRHGVSLTARSSARDDDCGRCRTRVLVADRAVSEVRRPSLAGDHRHGRAHALLRSGPGIGECVLERLSVGQCGTEGVDGGSERVDHRLVPALGRPELDDRGERRVERLDQCVRLDLLGIAEPASGLAQAGAPERAAGTADGRDERRAGRDQELAGRDAAVQVVELDLDGGEPARHVRAVIGIADGRVELGQVVTLLGDRHRAAAQPAIQRLDGHGSRRHAGQAPQRSAAVLTGASQSCVSSSSSSSNVTEAPAISRLVM